MRDEMFLWAAHDYGIVRDDLPSDASYFSPNMDWQSILDEMLARLPFVYRYVTGRLPVEGDESAHRSMDLDSDQPWQFFRLSPDVGPCVAMNGTDIRPYIRLADMSYKLLPRSWRGRDGKWRRNEFEYLAREMIRAA